MRKGRFRKSIARSAARYGESQSFDRRLYRHDITGSIAHAGALAKTGVISVEEKKKIETGLREIEREIVSGTFSWSESLEDVHMNIENALTKKIGEAGAKLHTARSRNDQVALDLRLYVKDEIRRASSQLKKLQQSLVGLARKHVGVVMPGYTHLQRAQPVLLAHYLLGHAEAFARDVERLRDCLNRTDVLPLGSAALAGSTIVLDRESMARDLKFSQVSQNSLDAVSDRDFVCEFVFCLAMIGMHLSRVSEDLILWSTSEFCFVEFSEEFSTGSSLMPQKKNPDMAELTRGKTGRLYGNLVSILTTLKALPSSYNRDLQEDKEALFDSVDTISAALEVFSAMIPKMKINREKMKDAAGDPNLLATDLAEYLVGKGMAFRKAHEVIGRLVAEAVGNKTNLRAIPLSKLRKLSSLFNSDVVKVFDVRRSLSARRAIGAPSPDNVKAQIKRWRKQLRG
jgi:argininosuccinate lyase